MSNHTRRPAESHRHSHLDAAAPAWLAGQRVENGTESGGIFPWTDSAADDNNRGMANIGQLKAVFALRFTRDTDGDGLPDLFEFYHGTDPEEPDSDDDGVTDGGEDDQGTDPNDAGDTPEAEWFILTGDAAAGFAKERRRTVHIPAGESRVIAVFVASEEYDEYTDPASTDEFNDTLTWDVRPEGETPITGSLDVNDRDGEWDAAAAKGQEAQGFSPVHVEAGAAVSAPDDAPLPVEIDLSATNIGDDILPSTVMVGLLPLEVRGLDEEAQVAEIDDESGVDLFSWKANLDPGDEAKGYQDKRWIMAPISGTGINGNKVRTVSGASATLEIIQSADTALPNPIILTEPETEVTWYGEGAVTDDSVLEVKVGNLDPIETRIGIKTMKSRNLTVYVHPIISVFPGRAPKAPDFVPTSEQLGDYLNQVFDPQINVTFSVTVLDALPVEWDVGEPDDYPHAFLPGTEPVPDDGRFDIRSGLDSVEQQAVLDASSEASGDLHVYLIGGAVPMSGLMLAPFGEDSLRYSPEPRLLGRAVIDENRVWIDADLSHSNYPEEIRTPEHRMNIIAHEIGHHLISDGHPDEGSGPASLDPGMEEHKHRLMSSGPSRMRNPSGTRILKAEWDAADLRMSANFEEPE